MSHVCLRLKSVLLEKFLDKNFLLDFVQKELKMRWNVAGEFEVLSLLEGILVF